MAYLPIEKYGIIGDMQTAALIGSDGSIDWFCCPYFDSPSVFAAILDDKIGGRFKIAPVDTDVVTKQFYLSDTNILITRFQKPDYIAEITDFMPVESEDEEHWNRRVLRRVQMIQGETRFRMLCQPAFDYARASHQAESGEHGVVFRSDALVLGLVSGVPIEIRDGAATCEFTLQTGEQATFMLGRMGSHATCRKALTDKQMNELCHKTSHFWQHWISQCTYTGLWQETIRRSALVLKLLTFDPTGAIIAAPTMGLPEAISGSSNWDYRYSWIRDANFTCYAFIKLGFYNEARRFVNWLEERCRELKDDDPGLQVMYKLDGSHVTEGLPLDHLTGYRNSQPVFLGNAASGQRQLDIYGEFMDAVYLSNKYDEPIAYDQWLATRKLLNWLCDNWQQKDQGIWEMHGAPQHFVYSRMMVWVALDRGLRIGEGRGLPADTRLWKQTRRIVYEDILANGWNEQRQAFVQAYGGDTLDASNLLMPLVQFIGPSDPRMLATISKTLDELTFDSLVHRYGGPGQKDSFSACSFWLVECLTRANRLDEARLKLEKMFSYANHLGLFAEAIGAAGEMLGNYPQALTHLSLISAAINLNRKLEKGTLMDR